MENVQDRANFTVDGVQSFVDELPKELQQLFAQVVVLRRKRDDASVDFMAMTRAVEHAESQLVASVRDLRGKAVVDAVETVVPTV